MIEIVSEYLLKGEARQRFELTYGPGGEWSNLSIPVTRSSASGDGDRLRIIVQNRGEETTGTYYFDDFSLMPAP